MNGKISQETIEKIRENSDLVSIIGEYAKIDQRGPDDFWCCCPFHSEKTASFKITPSKGMYYCFGCHVSGNAIKFVMEMEKLSFPEAINELAQKAGIEVLYENGTKSNAVNNDRKKQFLELYTRLSTTFHFFLTQSSQGKFALDYVLSRGISQETIEKFKLGFSPQDNRWLKKFLQNKSYSQEFLLESGLFLKNKSDLAFFHGRLMFPIFDKNGLVVAFGARILFGEGPKYLNSGNLLQYKKGETLFAYNFAKKTIQKEKSVILCEGYMDCIAYHQCGILNAVAPLGTALTEDQIKLFKGFAKTVYLSFDTDEAGQNATFKAILECRKHEIDDIRVIILHGAKDPAEILQKSGKNILTNAVKNAIIDSEFLLNLFAKRFGDSPDGKKRACEEFFKYIEILQSETQKSAMLEKLADVYRIPRESVLVDFRKFVDAKNYNYIDRRKNLLPNENSVAKNFSEDVKSELRFMLAVSSRPDSFSEVRREIGAEDFSSSQAKDLYLTMEECFRRGTLSTSNIAEEYAKNEKMRILITQATMGKEFSGNPLKIIKDGIREIKYKSLKRQKSELEYKMKQAELVHDESAVKDLFEQGIQIDQRINEVKRN